MNLQAFGDALERRLLKLTPVERAALPALAAHYELMLKWNRRLNLTTDLEFSKAVDKHYAECLWFWRSKPFSVGRVVDVGSGAGFPGLVIAAVAGDVEVTLVESDRRKAVFLREATRAWSNVLVVDSRAEEIGQTFDLAVSRAMSWDSLRGILPGLALRSGLLVTLQIANSIREAREYHWQEPILVPWSRERVALWGQVSRGTSQQP